MKYLILQKSGLPWHGIMAISAVLKENGNNIVDLILVDEEKQPLDYVKKFQPDFALFPVITGEHQWVQSLADEIKTQLPEVKTVFGGPHATFYPETLRADYVIRGESDNLERFIKSNRSISPYVEDVTTLPMPDRTIYYKYPHLAKASSKQFLTARGCFANCTFCSNHLIHRMYPKMPLVRRRTPKQVIREILSVKEKWGLKSVSFSDDVFLVDKRWLSVFLSKYKSEVKLPFICNTRFDIVNDELLTMLKDAGCHSLEMGVESGVQHIREMVLGKGKGDNAKIIQAGRLIKKYKFGLKTYNMVGLPTETLEDVFETIKLNSQIKADQTSCSFLTPYKGYDIAKYYPENIELTDSIYKPGQNVPKEIVNLQTFFFIASKYPWTQPIIRKLIKFPPNKFYRLSAMAIYGLFMAKVHKLTMGDMWRYSRHINPFRV